MSSEATQKPTMPARRSADLGRFLKEGLTALWPGRIAVPPSSLGQLRYLAQNQMALSPAAIIIYALFALVFVRWIGWPVPIIWAAAVGAAHLAIRVQSKELLALDAQSVDVGEWDRRFRLLFGMHNLLFASFAILFWVPNEPANHEYIMAGLAFSAAPILVLTSCYRPVFYAAAAPVAAVATAWLILHEGGVASGMMLIFAGVVVLLLQLAGAVNRTATAMLGLREDNDALIDELSAEKVALEQARQRAEEANEAKSRFLAKMSHELRTPLNAILGFSEIMTTEAFGPHGNEHYKEYSDDIHTSGQLLLGLIDDIVDLSRIEAGRFELSEDVFDIASVARDCRRVVELRAEARRVRLVEAFDADLPLLYADQRAIRQTLLNLLTNAIKFSPPEAIVTTVLKLMENGDLLIGVRDTGPGIAANEIDHVLDTFAQGKAGKASPEPGSGLGLAIVKGLIEVHGGSFALHSREGEGTSADAYLPPHRLRRREDADAASA